MNKFNLLFVLMIVPSLFFGMTQEQLKEKMIDDLKVIENCFEVKYALKEWKKIFNGWDLKEQMSFAKKKILQKEQITVRDYQMIVKQFFNSPYDYHVDVNFFSTAISFLPFKIKSAEGRYFIDELHTVTEDSLGSPNKKTIDLLAVGDEILEFNGKPIALALEEFRIQELGDNNSPTNYAYAQYYFTQRIGEIGHTLAEGPVNILVRSCKTAEVSKHTLHWEVINEEITDAPYKTGFYFPFSSPNKQKKIHPFFLKEMTLSSHYALLKANRQIFLDRHFFEEEDEEEEDHFDLKRKNGYLPDLGEVIWEAPSTFKYRAYVFKNAEGRKIGYIRIHDYLANVDHPKHFSFLINIFEDKTDALVIDQLDNPGGILLYSYTVASMLITEPIELFPQKVTLTQEDLYFALNDSKELAKANNKEKDEDILGFPAEQFFECLKHNVKFIIDEWNEGRQLTALDYVYGIKYLMPHTWGTYSKPILVLINERAGSCGDLLPALLQDNHRATLFGKNTAGGGGYVLESEHPSQFGISSYRLAGSFVERYNKQPIENLGVSPDIPYELTIADLQGNEGGERYQDYIKAVNEALNHLLPKIPPKNLSSKISNDSVKK